MNEMIRIDIETVNGNHLGPRTIRPPAKMKALPERVLFFRYRDISDHGEKKRENREIEGSGNTDLS